MADEGRRQGRRPLSLETLRIEQVLALHERAFGPLDGLAKRRMRERAEDLGWERTGHEIGLAA
jgi:hypothetical protein